MRVTTILCLALAAILSGACQPPVGQPTAEREGVVRALVWPQPPLQPRIRFIGTVARPMDLGIRPSMWQRVWEFIVGTEEQWFIRPTGVAADKERIYVADPGAQALWILDAQAGRFRKIQKADGQQLVSPVAVVLGSKNHIYLADSYLAKVFIYDAEGNLAGAIDDAKLRRPAGLAYDARRERLYIADSAAHRVWTFSAEGKSGGAIGRRGNGNGEFNFPTHLAVDRNGNLYITDALNFRLQIFGADGGFAGQFGRHGDASGDFASPKGTAVDSEGHIYVVDALFDAVQVFDRQGQYLLTFGERGVGPGQFWLPGGIFIDERDRIYVADAYNQRIQLFQYLRGGGDG